MLCGLKDTQHNRIHCIMLSKGTVWQGWPEDLLHHTWSAVLTKPPSIMRSSPELPSLVVYIGDFRPLMSFIDAMWYIMSCSGLWRALCVYLYQKFGSANHVRPYTQLRTVSSFPNVRLLYPSSCHKALCKIYEEVLKGESCMADAVQDQAVISLDQQHTRKHAW